MDSDLSQKVAQNGNLSSKSPVCGQSESVYE